MTFSPTDLPNLQLWLDAATLGLADGAAVSGTWTDGAGLGNATAVGGLTYRASAINSLPAVEFNGSTGFFTVADRAALRFQSRFYMAAVLVTGAGTAKTILCKGNTGADPDYLWMISLAADGKLNLYDGTAFRDSDAGAVTTTTAYLLEMWWDGANLYYFVNGVAKGAPAAGIPVQTSTDTLRIGSQGTPVLNSFDGKLAELVMVGNGAADATGETSYYGVRSLRNYLGAKYNLATSLAINYVGVYNGGTATPTYRIGGMVSEDSITWEKAIGGGVLVAGTGGSWDDDHVKDPHILKVGSVYHLYYSGYDGSNYQIGHATSSDGFAWTKDGSNPVLPRGGGGTWDETHVYFAYVMYDAADADPTKRWKMWYSGASAAAPGTPKIGYATSSDGVTWTKSGSNPILSPGAAATYDDEGVLSPVVVLVSSTWHLYYGGRPSTSNPEGYSLCRASASAAGGPYTKDAANPLLLPKSGGNAQALTGNTNSGSAIVAVADTSLYSVNEPLFLRDSTLEFSLVKVQSIDTATQLTLTTTVTRNWTTANTSTIRSAYFGSVIPRDIEVLGGLYKIFGSAFQQFAGSPFQERSIVATSSAPATGWSYDYTRGVILPLGPVWDTFSAENPSITAFDVPVVAGTLHARDHIVTASAPPTAGTLHARDHIVGAVTPINAGTLHARDHIVAASVPVVAGTLHAVDHIVPAYIATDAAITIAAFSRPATGSALATLARSGERKCRKALNEAGAGSFVLANGDVDLAACGFGSIVVFSHRTIPRWSMFVRRHDRISRAQGEEHDQVTSISGLGLASVLEEAVAWPEGGTEHLPFADVRYFNFASPLLDTSTWTVPVVVNEPPFSDPGTDGLRIPQTPGWPDPTAVGLWTRPQVPPGQQHPVGTCYFRTVPGALTVTQVTEAAIFICGDDEYEIWVDGLLLLDYHQPGRVRTVWPTWEVQQVNITLSAGDHLIAVKVKNLPLDDPALLNAHNIGELLVAVYSVNLSSGSGTALGSLLLNTNTADWIGLDYPPNPPGFTVGEVMNILLDEAQDRGALTDVTRTWTDALDSYGAAWPITADITIRVGLNLYNIARQLTEGYMDFAFAAAALEMSMWAQQGIDRSASAQLTGGVNLGSLRHTREG